MSKQKKLLISVAGALGAFALVLLALMLAGRRDAGSRLLEVGGVPVDLSRLEVQALDGQWQGQARRLSALPLSLLLEAYAPGQHAAELTAVDPAGAAHSFPLADNLYLIIAVDGDDIVPALYDGGASRVLMDQVAQVHLSQGGAS